MNTETSAEAWEGASAVRPVPIYLGAGVAVAIAVFGSSVFEDSRGLAPIPDARIVYCLDPVHQPAVADAAVALGLAPRATGADLVLSGHVLTLAQWRVNHRADFDRACLAQSAPAFSASGGGLEPTLTALLQVTFGAVLSFASGGYVYLRERASSLAGELRTAWTRFASAVVEFTASMPGGPDGRPPLAPQRERYTDLRSVLHRVEAHRNGWKAVRDVLDEIDQRLSPTAVSAQWNDADPNAVAARRAQISDELDKQALAVERIAKAVERPLRRRGRS
jgi:hypothetical protein